MALRPLPSLSAAVEEQAGEREKGAVQNSRAALGVEESTRKRRANEDDSLV